MRNHGWSSLRSAQFAAKIYMVSFHLYLYPRTPTRPDLATPSACFPCSNLCYSFCHFSAKFGRESQARSWVSWAGFFIICLAWVFRFPVISPEWWPGACTLRWRGLPSSPHAIRGAQSGWLLMTRAGAYKNSCCPHRRSAQFNPKPCVFATPFQLATRNFNIKRMKIKYNKFIMSKNWFPFKDVQLLLQQLLDGRTSLARKLLVPHLIRLVLLLVLNP